MESRTQAGHARSGLANILKNVAWLLGGKGFGAICSLVYLAILVRSLGVKDFGHFSLIFGTAQAMVAVAGFQTWQTIVRFGTPHILENHKDRFARLSVFGGVIDIAGAIGGTALAAIALYGFGDALELNPRYVDAAFLFVATLLFARGTASLGIIRVFDRYDLAVYVGAFTPFARLIAATFIWYTGPTVMRFLLAWGIIELITAIMMWIVAYRVQDGILKLSDIARWRATIRENPGAMGFLGITYLGQTIRGALQQGPLLAVGLLLGTSAAGAYRIADQLAKGLSKLATLVTQAIYPEVNRQRHESSFAQFRVLIRRISGVALGAGVVVVVLAVTVGPGILVLIGGTEFAGAGSLLLPLALAASFDLAAVAFEPVLHAYGKAHWSLAVRTIGIVVMTASILALVGFGVAGVSWGVAIGFGITFLVFGLTVRLVMRGDGARA